METPYDVRDEAMNDLVKAYDSNFAAKRRQFNMKFRSKKDPLQSIVIHSKHWGRTRGEFAFLPQMKAAEPLPAQLLYDSRLIVNRLGEFYLCIPMPLEVRAENQGPFFTDAQEMQGSGIIALDPGVRTFMTGYDPSGLAIEWGKNDIARIYRLCHAHDKIQSKRDTIHGRQHKRQRYKLRRAMLRIHKKTRCLVDDCHRKLAKWLCENYRVVLLPEFRTQKMVKRGLRRIRSRTARAMCTWSHYRFRQHLIHKAHEHPWCRIIVCTEEYTSRRAEAVAISIAAWVDPRFFDAPVASQRLTGTSTPRATFSCDT